MIIAAPPPRGHPITSLKNGCSVGAGYITGQILAVGGEMTAS
jgi:hypothetical protein